jgi:hypothetical protein
MIRWKVRQSGDSAAATARACICRLCVIACARDLNRNNRSFHTINHVCKAGVLSACGTCWRLQLRLDRLDKLGCCNSDEGNNRGCCKERLAHRETAKASGGGR